MYVFYADVSSGDDENNVGIIVGVVGGLVAIIIVSIIIFAVLLYRHHSKKESKLPKIKMRRFTYLHRVTYVCNLRYLLPI